MAASDTSVSTGQAHVGLLGLMKEVCLSPVVDRTFPLSRMAIASHGRARSHRSGRHVMNKIALQKILDEMEFHRVLKIQVIDAPAGKSVRLKLPFSSTYAHLSSTGNYHGGVIASLSEVAGTLACILNGERPFATIHMSIDFLTSPRSCDLYASAKVLKSGSNLSVADIEITDEANVLYAASRGLWSGIASDGFADRQG